MKKRLLILSALFCSAFIVMYILVQGAEPDRIFTNVSRQYKIYQLQPADTIFFPGRVSIMRAAGPDIYGYVYSQKTIFRYNTLTQVLDTFFNEPLPIITRMELSPDARTHYIFNATQDTITTLHAGGQQQYYLFSGYDSLLKTAQLHLRDFGNPAYDTVLKNFTRFEDGGLSADGFFVNNDRYLFHVPFYNAEVLMYDTYTHQVKTFSTIDHTPPSNIAVPSGDIYYRSSKAVIVNSSGTADAEHLYVLSFVKSQDAVKSGYDGPSVDVYNISDMQYAGSFLLPGYQHIPVLQMAISSDTLIAAYERNILRFKMTHL